jgi:fibronectin-binding autotransporter adhesin
MNKSSIYTLLIVFLLYGVMFGGRYPYSSFDAATPLLHPLTSHYKLSYNNPQVKLKIFNAYYSEKKVLLNWKSNMDFKCDYFTIEKSKDGTHFSTAFLVKGSGNSKIAIDYSDIDYAPLNGLSYYRLKQTDYEGHVLYSTIIPVNFQYSKDGTIVARTEDPTDNIELSVTGKKETLVVVRDKKGSEYTAKVIVSKDKNQNLYAIDTKNLLNKGSYLVVASSNNAIYSQNLVIK